MKHRSNIDFGVLINRGLVHMRSDTAGKELVSKASGMRLLLAIIIAITTIMGATQVAVSGELDTNPGDISLGNIGDLGGPDGFGELAGPGGAGIGLPGMTFPEGPGGMPDGDPELLGIPEGQNVQDEHDDNLRGPVENVQ